MRRISAVSIFERANHERLWFVPHGRHTLFPWLGFFRFFASSEGTASGMWQGSHDVCDQSQLQAYSTDSRGGVPRSKAAV